FFAIDIDRDKQSRFMMFEGQKTHEDNQVLEAQNIIETNLKDKITVSDLAEKTSLGRRSLERRFKKATNNTVLEYIQRIKIEAAKRSFEMSNKNISEVMYDVGYSDTKSFRTTFKRITGMTPIEYRSKYYKE
ncbi:MAG: helix-turn-helix domain-containing protein, partial [Candidatus Kapaibacterium sp.]